MPKLSYRLCEAPQFRASVGTYDVLVFPAPADTKQAASPYLLPYRSDLGVYARITDIVKARRKSQGGIRVHVGDDYFLHIWTEGKNKPTFPQAANSALDFVSWSFGLYPVHAVSSCITTMAKFPNSDQIHELQDALDGERGYGPFAQQLCEKAKRISELDAKVEIHEFGWIKAVFVFYSNLDVEMWCGESVGEGEDHYHFVEEPDPVKLARGLEELRRIASMLDERVRNGDLTSFMKSQEWRLMYCKPRLDHGDVPSFGIATHDPLGRIDLFKQDMRRNFGFQFRC